MKRTNVVKKSIAIIMCVGLACSLFGCKSTKNAKSDSKYLIGLLYDMGQDASTSAISDAKKILDEKNIAYKEYTGTTVDEVSLAVDSAIADKVDAIFTPTDNTIMTAELSIYEKIADAGIMHFAGADSFALNGAFLGYGVDYAELGRDTADMIEDVLIEKKDVKTLEVEHFDNGTATINIDICEKLGIDFDKYSSIISPYCEKINTITTSDEFEDPISKETSAALKSGLIGDTSSNTVYKVGICNYVDDASLNQIVSNIKYELDQIGKEERVAFDIYYDNANADSNVLNQIISDFEAKQVDLMVAVATPVAIAMQSATENTKTPVIFAAVSDPIATNLVVSLETPGGNISGTSDYLDTKSIIDLMIASLENK